MISLRAQPTIVSEPACIDGVWQFEFTVETPGVYSANNDLSNLEALLSECDGIPMVVGLNEQSKVKPSLTVTGPDQNLWFTAINK